MIFFLSNINFDSQLNIYKYSCWNTFFARFSRSYLIYFLLIYSIDLLHYNI